MCNFNAEQAVRLQMQSNICWEKNLSWPQLRHQWIVSFPSITIGQSLKFIKNLDLFACFKESEKLITFYFQRSHF